MFGTYQTMFTVYLSTLCSVHIRHSSLFTSPPHVLYISDTVPCLPLHPTFFTYQTQFTVCLHPNVLYISGTFHCLSFHPMVEYQTQFIVYLSTPCSVHIRYYSLFTSPPNVQYISDTVHCLHLHPIFCTYQTQFTVYHSTPCSVHIRHSHCLPLHPMF